MTMTTVKQVETAGVLARISYYLLYGILMGKPYTQLSVGGKRIVLHLISRDFRFQDFSELYFSFLCVFFKGLYSNYID